jgi:hypothetical protein
MVLSIRESGILLKLNLLVTAIAKPIIKLIAKPIPQLRRNSDEIVWLALEVFFDNTQR